MRVADTIPYDYFKAETLIKPVHISTLSKRKKFTDEKQNEWRAHQPEDTALLNHWGHRDRSRLSQLS
jgi:hypothetical protein